MEKRYKFHAVTYRKANRSTNPRFACLHHCSVVDMLQNKEIRKKKINPKERKSILL